MRENYIERTILRQQDGEDGVHFFMKKKTDGQTEKMCRSAERFQD